MRGNFINKLRKNVVNSNKQFEFDKIRSIGFLVDLEAYYSVSYLRKISDVLGLQGVSVEIIGYLSKKDKNIEYPVPVFVKSEVGSSGKIKNDDLKQFLDKEFDVLVNYFSEDKMPLLAASALTKASLKVGFATVDQNCNDLIFNCEIKDADSFFGLLKNYLKVIKK